MKIYFAPMEGVTGYIYRNIFNSMFGRRIDKYFSPFIMAHEKCGMSPKEIKDVLPENNIGISLVPQVMTNSSTEFFILERILTDMGYKEINLNFGCPSKTVTSRNRGAGILNDTTLLEKFLDNVFENNHCEVSVKTRIGVSDPEEFVDLLDIYNRFPIKELIIHPRIMHEFYEGIPHTDVFEEALAKSKNPIVYNGNIFSKDSRYLDYFENEKCSALMIGRGLVSNPGLASEICGDERISIAQLYEFASTLCDEFEKQYSGETPVLFKMKEIWGYIGGKTVPESTFEIDEKIYKKMLKTKSLKEFKILEKQVLI